MVRTMLVYSAGGVICRERHGRLEVALIATKHRTRWQLPKGWIKQGETPVAAARREVAEETGLTGRVIEKLDTIEFWFISSPGQRQHKFVDFYLMEYERGTTDNYDPREVDGASWFPIEEALQRITFRSERAVMEKVPEAWARYRAMPTQDGPGVAR